MFNTLSKDNIKSEEDILIENELFINDISLFLQELKKSKKPLKIWDDAIKPTLWTDVVCSDLKSYNWLFSVETKVTDLNKSQILEIQNNQYVSSDNIPNISLDSLQMSSIDNFLVESILDSNEKIIEITRLWLSSYFPNYNDIPIVWDKKSFRKHMLKLNTMSLLREDDINK